METERVNVTESQIIEAIREAIRNALTAGGTEGAAVTAEELAQATGRGILSVRRALKGLIEAGTMEATRVRRLTIDGRPTRIPAYRLREPPEQRNAD